MNDLRLINLASTCKSIINDPENNINQIKHLLSTPDEITLLSLFKVFKSIIPLYRVKIMEDKIKHKKEFIKLQNYDKAIYYNYKSFVNTIVRQETIVSYQISIEMLNLFDHFNFTERVINKVFKGTKHENKEISTKSIEILIDKVMNDEHGHVTFKIILELLEFKWNDLIYEALTEIKAINHVELEYLDYEIGIIQKKDEISKEAKKKKQMIIKNKFGKNIEKTSLRSRKDKKSDSEMKKIEKNVQNLELKDKEKGKRTMLKTLVDNVMRIFFIILKEKKTNLYEYAFIGLKKYKRFIRNEFSEGIIIMINECIKESDFKSKVLASDCFMNIFGCREYDFKIILENLFIVLEPLNFNIEPKELKITTNLLRKLLIERRQNSKRVQAFIHRMILFSSFYYDKEFFELINCLIKSYDIDLTDFEGASDYLYDYQSRQLDKISWLPFYEISIFNKLRITYSL